MKRLKLSCLLALLLFVVSVNVMAYDAKIGGIYYNFNGDEAEVTCYSSYGPENKKAYSGSVVIPSSITNGGKEYLVTSIGDNAFYYCSGLTSVTIPSSVTSIGGAAFSSCSGLTSLTIPSSVTGIGGDAFWHCSGLTNVTIPEGVTSIGSNTFRDCFGLTSIAIPASVKDIGDSAFLGCSSLSKIVVPDIAAWCSISFGNSYANPLVVAHRLYSDENTEITNLIIPEGVASVGSSAFSGCSSLASVTIPPSVTNIGSSAFSGCSSLASVTIPSSVTSIDNHVFSGCSSLTGVTIPSSVTSIGDGAFADCSSLTSVTIPEVVTSIGDRAFYNCFALTSVTIPSSVTRIGNYAFYGCSDQIKIIVPDIAAWCGIYFKSKEANPLYYAHHLYSDESTEITNLIIPEGVATISPLAFYGCTGLTSVTLPSSFNRIAYDAFTETGIRSVFVSDEFNGSINDSDFPENTKFYVHRGTVALLCLWQSVNNVYEIGTGIKLLKPSTYLTSSTQSSLTLEINNKYDEYQFGFHVVPNNCIITDLSDGRTLVSGLRPESENDVYIEVSKDDKTFSLNRKTFSTLPITPRITVTSQTASSVQGFGSYLDGDAEVTATKLIVGGKEQEGNTLRMTGLEPNTTYKAEYVVTVTYGDKKQNTYEYKTSGEFKTAPLSLSTLGPKVVSLGNVIVAAEANVDDEEENVGFEWRRTDWTDDFASNTGIAYLYEGTMEGYIRNLNTDKLWKYRPFYLADSGTYYYGDWMGLDPTNTSYFDPTVHTYAKIEIIGNTALVKGYALNGTDKIVVQGFKYWKKANKANSASMGIAKAPVIPANAMTAEAEGRVMEATLSGLDYETDYDYVAFVKTTEGETFYGDVRSFTTGENTTGISDMTHSDGTSTGGVREVARYNLRGQRIDTPERGVNIIRYSDGTTRKVVVK